MNGKSQEALLEEALAALSRCDYPRAFDTLKPLAEFGDVRAQTYLSWLYRRGRGIPRSNVLAFMWADLAAKRGNGRAAGYRQALIAEMTGRELAHARYLAEAWVPTSVAIAEDPPVRRFLAQLLSRARAGKSPENAIPPRWRRPASGDDETSGDGVVASADQPRGRPTRR